jgi:hypothetical protein
MNTVAKQPPLVVDIETAQTAVVRTPAPQTDVMAVIERVASNPDADITKLERLIDLKRTLDADRARAEFNAAFAEMQPKIPVIIERGNTDKGTYAELEDIVEVIRPILAGYGLSSSRAGITSGSKNAIQALGSDAFLRAALHDDRAAEHRHARAMTTTASSEVQERRRGAGRLREVLERPEVRRAGRDRAPDGGVQRRRRSRCADHLLKHHAKDWAALKNQAQKAAR